MMDIRPVSDLRNKFTEIERTVKRGKPVYLTKNGEGDLVVMDIDSFTHREKMLALREQLLAVEEDRLAGRKGCTIDELDSYLDAILSEGGK